MSLTLEALKAGLSYPNVLAFLRVIRERESGQGPDAYLMINGGGRMEGFQRHPWENVPTTQGARACGAYQFLGTTWGGLCRQYEFPDFSPESQDLGAIALIKERGALGDVIAGRIEQAIAKLRPVWTSLPGASESSASWTMSKALAVYTGAGGTLDNAELLGQPETPAASPEPVTPSPEPSMPLPLLAIVSAITTWGPTIAALIPQVATLFDHDKQTPAKLEAAQAVVQKIVETTGAVNTEAAIGAVTSNPAMLEKVRAAVVTAPEIMPYLVVEVGGGFEAARAANAVLAPAGTPTWQNPALWVTLLLILFPLLLVIDVFYVHPTLYSGELRTQIVTGVLGVIFVVSGYWLGGSIGSARKTDIMAAQQGVTK
jgi:muramidase (phage lysozyme)